MKTTRKGFTLIELIVVIAIIGVLAAILVPAMLGYVKKSKIQAANADAKTILTNINSAFEEIDEEGVEIDAKLNNTWQGGLAADKVDSWTKVIEYAKEYSDSIQEKGQYAVYVKEGVGVCAIAKSGKYFGTYPGGLTNKNYDKELSTKDAAGAKAYAIAKYNDGRDADSQIKTGT